MANELASRILIKAAALLAVYGTALAFAWLAYLDYRDSNIRRITVSKLSDLEQEFEVGDAVLRVKNPEFLKVCFAGDYAYALKDARQWFGAADADFIPALRAAGGRADSFNGEEQSSIVLLSHRSAVIVRLDRRTGFSVVSFGCANADEGEIMIRKYLTNSSKEFVLPNATLKAAGQGQPPLTLCAQGLQRFVESIDERLNEGVDQYEHYWADIRKFLPRRDCAAEETIRIAKTSRFFMAADERGGPIKYTVILFGNSDTVVRFALEKKTGDVVSPFVGPLHPPTPSL
jgi:hypothetical protein